MVRGNDAAHERDVGRVQVKLDLARGLGQLRERGGDDRQHQLASRVHGLSDELSREQQREVEHFVRELLLVARRMFRKRREQPLE